MSQCEAAPSGATRPAAAVKSTPKSLMERNARPWMNYCAKERARCSSRPWKPK